MQGLGQAQGGLQKFVSRARAEVAQLRGFMNSTTGVLTQLGLGIAAVSTVKHSAQTDQSLTRIKQTAGLTTDQVTQLRGELHRMSQATGNDFDALREGFDKLVAGGLDFNQSLPTIKAINDSMRVTGAEATTLAGALQSAQANFQFDLTQPKMAADLLDQMTVAGRAGVIELEDLSGVFASAAGNANKAKLSFEQTLAVIEGLATATTKDRVGTLVDSTLRLFTNANYMKEAQKATGVKFFDKAGARRNPLDILTDIQGRYNALGTDKDRFKFLSAAFGKADQDTIKGIQQALSGNQLANIRSIAAEVEKARGTTGRDLPEAMNNAVAQGGVLKETLATVGDQISQPINKALAETIKTLTGAKDKGGLGLDGWQLLGGGALAAGGAYVGGRAARGVLGNLLSKFGANTASLGAGVVAGKALKDAGAATPVYIVGAAPGLFSGLGGGGVLDALGGKAKKGGLGGALATLGSRVALPAALLAPVLSRYAGTLTDGMDDSTLKQDVSSTMRRGRGRGLLAAANRANAAAAQRVEGEIAVEVTVRPDGRSVGRVTSMKGIASATVNNRSNGAGTGRMMEPKR
ncbi:phage tail tape measure protein [Pseudoxanthomonas winnipegensis]|uniref:phage tail tape measure protein n=1 Tax=Pseudoxanthomonas winnipegensis TaxID=2480810 RepID=UPI0013F155BB|nr:phage tail tape measure protein [Pseudoxanthomonas winnipegensis]